ncbi:MAG: hypothetical protein KAJ51_02470 [Thermoplasmata archaeon]|nr:hypothetical protein [Thermoplasmata archaeon]
MTRGENALEHQSRKKIYEFIFSHPGSTFNTLKTFFNMHPSTLIYHLKYLERSGKIICKNEGSYNCYYSTIQSQLNMTSFHKAKFNTLNESQKQLLSVINNNPGITKKELIFITRIESRSLNYSINKLVDLKFLWEVNNGDEIGYEFISRDKLNKKMLNRLIMKLLKEEITGEQFLRIKKKLDELEIEEII